MYNLSKLEDDLDYQNPQPKHLSSGSVLPAREMSHGLNNKESGKVTSFFKIVYFQLNRSILQIAGISSNEAALSNAIGFLKSMVQMLAENAQEGEQQPETLKGSFKRHSFILSYDLLFKYF